MTGADAKNALVSGEPVEYDGIIYERIQQIIYNRCRDGISVSAVMVDRTGRSTSTALVRRINRIGECGESIDAQNALMPIESIELRTYAGTLRIEISAGENGRLVTEGGELALPVSETPYHASDSALELLQTALGRIRDTAHRAIGDWHEAHGLDRYTGQTAGTCKKE